MMSESMVAPPPPADDVEVIRIQHPTTLLSGTSAAPTNEQILSAVESTKKVLERQIETSADGQLDETGLKIATAADRVLQTTEDLVYYKNRDDKIQKFLQHVVDFGRQFKEQAQQAQQKAGGGPQLYKTAQEAYDRFRQLGEHLRNLLRHLLTSAEFRGLVVDSIDVFDRLFTQAKKKAGEIKDKARDDLKDEAKSATSDHTSAQQTKDQAREKADKVGDQAKQAGKELKEAAREEADDLQERLRSLLERIAANKDYRRLSDEALGLIDFLVEKKDEAKQAAQQSSELDALASELRSLYDEAAAVVSEFVGRKDLKAVEKKFVEFVRTLADDQQLAGYLHKLREWSSSLLDHPEKLTKSAAGDDDKTQAGAEARKLLDEGRRTWEESKAAQRASELWRELAQDWRHMLTALQKDEYAAALRESFAEVQQAFEGSVFAALSQTRLLVVPILKEILTEIPLPKIIGRTADSAYTIDGLVLRGRELSLDDITFELNFGAKEAMELIVKINRIEGVLRDAHFTYVSSGLFDWEDEGTFTCRVAAPRWKLKWVMEEVADQPLRLRLVKVDGAIDKLDITIEQARHKLLDRVSLALFSGEIKRKTCLVAENALLHQARLLTQKFNQFFLQKHFYDSPAAAQGWAANSADGSFTVTSFSQQAAAAKSDNVAPQLDSDVALPPIL